jgi:hypothetical protein
MGFFVLHGQAQEQLVRTEGANELHADRQATRGRAARKTDPRQATRIGECRKDGVATRANRLAVDCVGMREIRSPRLSRNGGGQDHVGAREDIGQLGAHAPYPIERIDVISCV